MIVLAHQQLINFQLTLLSRFPPYWSELTYWSNTRPPAHSHKIVSEYAALCICYATYTMRHLHADKKDKRTNQQQMDKIIAKFCCPLKEST